MNHGLTPRESLLVTADSIVAALLMRGHVAQSLALADTGQWLQLFEAALLRATPPDSAGRVFDRWLDNPAGSRRIADGSVYWAISGDTTRLRRAMQLAVGGMLPGFPAPLISGMQALARGDSSGAIAALTLPDSGCAGWCWEARLPLAFLSLRGRARSRGSGSTRPGLPRLASAQGHVDDGARASERAARCSPQGNRRVCVRGQRMAQGRCTATTAGRRSSAGAGPTLRRPDPELTEPTKSCA